MRSGNWNLRMYSIKERAPLFSAYDRITYQRLIPRHIAELLRAPPELLHCLQNGGFAVSLSGNYTIITTKQVPDCNLIFLINRNAPA